MDDETREAFADLRTLMNDQFERVLNRMTGLERRMGRMEGGFYDIVSSLSSRLRDVEDRLDRLEG